MPIVLKLQDIHSDVNLTSQRGYISVEFALGQIIFISRTIYVVVHCGKYLNSTPNSLYDLIDFIENLIVPNFVK